MNDNIFSISSIDEKPLKEGIQYFCDNESEAKRKGVEARKYVENYTWEKYGERLVKAYERLR